ncbi:MAG TPA: hypothetical protein VFJ82_03205 [Longimicrobium sp.]|nr:hypothetical protein [Longimicrobium sp.]
MIRKLDVGELAVTSFETAITPQALPFRYTPDCCTDDNSGCQTGPETGCTTDTTQAV